jgi:hypothetical protein
MNKEVAERVNDLVPENIRDCKGAAVNNSTGGQSLKCSNVANGAANLIEMK